MTSRRICGCSLCRSRHLSSDYLTGLGNPGRPVAASAPVILHEPLDPLISCVHESYHIYATFVYVLFPWLVNHSRIWTSFIQNDPFYMNIFKKVGPGLPPQAGYQRAWSAWVFQTLSDSTKYLQPRGGFPLTSLGPTAAYLHGRHVQFNSQ